LRNANKKAAFSGGRAGSGHAQDGHRRIKSPLLYQLSYAFRVSKISQISITAIPLPLTIDNQADNRSPMANEKDNRGGNPGC